VQDEPLHRRTGRKLDHGFAPIKAGEIIGASLRSNRAGTNSRAAVGSA
jgi:hypothetical protein